MRAWPKPTHAARPPAGKAKNRRRTKSANPSGQTEPPLEPEAARLMRYGAKLAELVAGGLEPRKWCPRSLSSSTQRAGSGFSRFEN
ncbi:hypothetical protein ACWDLG_43885 [Nonomuraea sp. NPDC003727]